MKKDILFYSNHCDFSKEVVKILSNSVLDKTIKYVCIDNP